MSTRSRLRSGWTALQEALPQSTEAVTRTARFGMTSTGVDEIDPPDALDQYWTQYKETAIARANLGQFISDVVEPGVRVVADDDTTEAYFMGGEDAPESAPSGGFLSQSFVHAGERHQPFLPGLKTTIANRWVRGTVLVELLKQDREDAESPITGFYHLAAETIHPQVESLRNILLPPDPEDLPSSIGEAEVTMTPRGEVAAYIQFSERSVLGRRNGGFDRKEIAFSQNDVMKQTLDPDIGGGEENEQGIFGTSIFESISTDVEEYNATKRDRYKAIQRKAYGIWLAQFSKEALDLGANNPPEIVEWSDKSQSDFSTELENLGPGQVMEADGPVELKEFQSDVPELDSTLDHYVDDITAPLPAPKYSVGFEKNINQFVTERQEERYEQLIQEERQLQSRKWTWAFRQVAERHDRLDPSGLRLVIEPEEDDSPIRSLDSDTIEDILTWMEAADLAAGPTQGPGTIIDDETLLTEVLQLPEDVAPDMTEADSMAELEAALEAGAE